MMMLIGIQLTAERPLWPALSPLCSKPGPKRWASLSLGGPHPCCEPQSPRRKPEHPHQLRGPTPHTPQVTAAPWPPPRGEGVVPKDPGVAPALTQQGHLVHLDGPLSFSPGWERGGWEAHPRPPRRPSTSGARAGWGASGCGKAAPRATLHVCVSARVSVYLCVSAASLSWRISFCESQRPCLRVSG